ncbi:MAG: 2'-5' RNA ligase family protein [Acidimicrobiales bacterium]
MDPQRMFLSVRPPSPASDVVNRLDRTAGAVRWEDPDHWHITIRFFPRAPADEVIAAIAGLESLAAPTVVLGPAVAILGKGVVIVPAAGLDGLAAAVDGATRRFAAAAGSANRPYTGHLTLGRLRRGNTTCALVGQPVRVAFLAHELELVVSTPQAGGGHRHDVVHRWGLPSISAA